MITIDEALAKLGAGKADPACASDAPSEGLVALWRDYLESPESAGFKNTFLKEVVAGPIAAFMNDGHRGRPRARPVEDNTRSFGEFSGGAWDELKRSAEFVFGLLDASPGARMIASIEFVYAGSRPIFFDRALKRLTIVHPLQRSFSLLELILVPRIVMQEKLPPEGGIGEILAFSLSLLRAALSSFRPLGAPGRPGSATFEKAIAELRRRESNNASGSTEAVAIENIIAAMKKNGVLKGKKLGTDGIADIAIRETILYLKRNTDMLSAPAARLMLDRGEREIRATVSSLLDGNEDIAGHYAAR